MKNISDFEVDRTPIERCPTGAIVWLDSKLGPTHASKGKEGMKPHREKALCLLDKYFKN